MQRAPRQWCLTKTETVNTFENWRQNLVYTLSLDPNFAQFIASDAKWEKRCAAHPNRGFTDDIDLASGRTAIQQTYMLDLMLGQIANFCPVISRNTIAKNATSLSGIWQTIRLHSMGCYANRAVENSNLFRKIAQNTTEKDISTTG